MSERRTGVILDLTMPFSEKTIPVPGHPYPEFEPLTLLERDGVRNTIMTISIHTGTHIDAPSHFIEDGATIDEIPIDRFYRPGVRLDLRGMTQPGAPITLEHLNEAILLIENLMHLPELPRDGFDVMAFPLKLVGENGGPTRVVVELNR